MAEENAGEEQQQKKPPLLLFIIIALVLVAGSVGGTLFFLNSGDGEEEIAAEEVTPPAIYFAINPKFQTNYDVDGRPRLFQLAIALVTREQDVVDALGTHLPTIKSRLVILLSGQKFKALQTPEGREELREQCLLAVQEILNKEIGKPGVEKVLFTDFVMQ
ncbi:MAG: flagellar basal body-associated FliL family protein [Pseudomonadales bacterium]